MAEQATRRAPGRPKRAEDQVVVEAPVSAPEPKKSAPKRKVIQKLQEDRDVVYTIPKLGGVAYMLKQKGITVYDESTDSVRAMRYCPNEQSIWVDEQGANARKEAVVFRDGSLLVPKEKPNLRKFLELHPGNFENGGNIFKKLDPSREAEEKLKSEFLVTDAVTLVRDKEIQELLPVAIYFGMSVNRKSSDIRYDLLNLAKKKPKEFIESFDSPQVMCRTMIVQAVDYQILRAKSDGVYWFDTNSLIVSVPVGQDSIDVMTRFCLTEKGASTLTSIEERLDKIS